jgi:hypothetical protein
MVLRCPSVTLLSICVLLLCQARCCYGAAEQESVSARARDGSVPAPSIPDYDSEPTPAPLDPCEDSSGCDQFCCSDAVTAQPISLDRLGVTVAARVSWSCACGYDELGLGVIGSRTNPPLPQQSLRTVILLI